MHIKLVSPYDASSSPVIGTPWFTEKVLSLKKKKPLFCLTLETTIFLGHTIRK